MHIAMDMGTSNTRLWLCDNENVRHFVRAPFGAGVTKTKGKAFLFSETKNIINTLLDEANIDRKTVDCIIASGMGGSELGLIEIPRISLPADAYMLAGHLHPCVLPEITSIPFVFVPGLKKCQNQHLQDIIRGEETEAIGILQALPLVCDSLLLLPGTHNKVLSISKEGMITDFYTTMSGELLSCIISNSILSGDVGHQFMPDEAFVLKGAACARENGLNTALFQIRVMSLSDVGTDALSSYLYGCVLSEDIDNILKAAQNRPIFVGGNETLKRIYCILLGEHAQPVCEKVASNATRIGLFQMLHIYRNLQSRNSILDAIAQDKLIAIIRNPDRETLLPAVAALNKGGVRLFEVTFDRRGHIPQEETAALIRLMKEELSVMVGAGTVTSQEELLLAYKAGASYIISPNCDTEIIRKARKLGLVSIPAAYTPTEIAAAIHAGADYIKIFPADALPKGYIKAIKAPLCDAKLLAVGGITKENASNFISDGFSGVGVGSNLYRKELIAIKDWNALENLARTYVDAVKKA